MSLRIERLGVRRGGRTILSDVELDVGGGEILGVVGKNGCGKSTLLLAIAGVLEPFDGRVEIAGASVWGSTRERGKARKALGYVPEAADPPGFLLGGELWAMCAAARGVAGPSDDLVARLGLDDVRELRIERMSLGQRRRTCIAAALLGPPKLLVLDEPDNGLDAARTIALAELLLEHKASGNATVIATHDRALLDKLGARVYDM